MTADVLKWNFTKLFLCVLKSLIQLFKYQGHLFWSLLFVDVRHLTLVKILKLAQNRVRRLFLMQRHATEPQLNWPSRVKSGDNQGCKHAREVKQAACITAQINHQACGLGEMKAGRGRLGLCRWYHGAASEYGWVEKSKQHSFIHIWCEAAMGMLSCRQMVNSQAIDRKTQSSLSVSVLVYVSDNSPELICPNDCGCYIQKAYCNMQPWWFMRRHHLPPGLHARCRFVIIHPSVI